MSKTTVKHSVKKINFTLILFVLQAVFICENGFAQKRWNTDYVQLSWNAQRDMIGIAVGVYDYSYGPNCEHGYLDNCLFEASFDNKKYFKLMEIQTPRQLMSFKTIVFFKNKFVRALIKFSKNINLPGLESTEWEENLGSYLRVYAPTSSSEELSVVTFGWHLNEEFKDVSYIRISGRWQVDGSSAEEFQNIVYNLKNTNKIVLKSNTTDIITKDSENDIVNILKYSEAITIKGVYHGSNIKVYSTSGLEVKSDMSNNDVFKIKLPANQIYIVHIGKSRYKVAL